MSLARRGWGESLVASGARWPADLPRGQNSGLKTVRRILGGAEGIHFAEMGAGDVVRHALVGRIVDAYDYHEQSGTSSREANSRD